MGDLVSKIESLIAETEKATPEPWFNSENKYVAAQGYFVAHVNETIGVPGWNVEFIASARTGYPSCLRALKKAVRELEWYKSPGIHERWRAEEALAEIEKELG